MADLNDLLNLINFKPEELSKISGALNNVLETIKSKASEGKIPVALYFDAYGSVKRKTKIEPLDDIDILYIVGKAEKKPNENMHIITQCSYEFGKDDYEPENNISSILLLNKLRNAVYETYSTSKVKKDKEVVNVYLSSSDVGFDITPAFDITNENYYLIAAADGTHYWKRTNPFVGNAFIDKVNTKINGHFRNTLKIMKYWFQKKKIRSPKSYHLECVLAYYFSSIEFEISNLFAALYAAYYSINFNSYLNNCPDPFNTSQNLTSGLTVEDIKKIEDEAKYARELLLESVEDFVKYIEPELE